MIAFDTDVLSLILLGQEPTVGRASAIPLAEQFVPIIAIEEILRGRLNAVRLAESGQGKLDIASSYRVLELTIFAFRGLNVLSYSPAAETLFQTWRQQKVRASTHDLRIAAICVTHGATLVSRNRRDFERVPGLTVEFWS
jgi:tRNA(fMet)-specific endonuclease VapC